MKRLWKNGIIISVGLLFFEVTIPVAVSANEVQLSWLEENSININQPLFLNGKEYSSEEELLQLLNTGYFISNANQSGISSYSLTAATAGTYFIPGVGQVILTATGVILIGGIAITSGHWAYKTIVNFFKSHSKNMRKSNYNKHTKPRPGRSTEKKKNNPHWKPRNRKTRR